MRQGTKRRLAVNTMVDLALRAHVGPVPLSAVADRLQVAPSCLEHLFARLRAAGLVQSTRGAGGGYALSRDAADISVADIVAAVETGGAAADARFTLANDVSQQLHATMHEYMGAIALADLVPGPRVERAPARAPRQPQRIAVVPRPQPRPINTRVPNSVFSLGTVMAAADAWPFGR